jgi:hypothetical protein
LGGDKREENGDEKWMVKDPSATELRPLRKTLEPIVERVPREPFVDLVSICHCIVEVFGTWLSFPLLSLLQLLKGDIKMCSLDHGMSMKSM